LLVLLPCFFDFNNETKFLRAPPTARQVVKKNQVDMDRQRGIASVHGQRAKADQALIQQKQREQEAFAARQAQLHQKTEAAQNAARQRDANVQAEQESKH
jgi:hypothetical protein